MTNTTKTTATPAFGPEFWAEARAEREAQAVADRRSDLLVEREWERRDVLAEFVVRLARRVEAADAQVAEYAAERGVNHAYYRGKGEGLEVALAVLRGVIHDRNLADEAGR